MPANSPTQSLIDFARGFIGERPVYNLGRKIGYVNFRQGTDTALNKLCGGTIQVYAGEAIGDPKTWYTFDDFNRKVLVSKLCMDKGIAPSSLTVEQKAAVVQKPTGQLTFTPESGFALVGEKTPLDNLPFIVAGGAVALGLILIVARR